MANEFEQINDPKLIQSMTNINSQLQLMALNMGKVFSESEKLKTEFDNTANSAKSVTEKQAAYSKILDQTAINEKKLTEVKIKLEQTEKGLNDELVKSTVKLQEANKAQKDRLKTEGLAETSLVAMRQKLAQLNKEYDTAAVRTKDQEKAIQSLTKEIKAAEGATGRHQREVGNYGNAFSGMFSQLKTGELGIKQFTQGVLGLAKSFFILLFSPPFIVLAITAIVAAFAGIVAVFKSTDSGANALKGAFEGLKNVVDILVDRAERLLKLDFKGAFGGAGKAMKEAATAGYDYVQTMDDINDRESSSIMRQEKLKKKYEELYTLSKDQNLSRQDQIKYAQEAIAVAEELNGIELGFLKEKNTAEEKNIASKIQNNNLTTEQKIAQLKQWIEVDDKELNSLMEKDKAFAEFYNKNEDAFQKLQKNRAAETSKEAEVTKETRRLRTGLNSDIKSLNDQAAADAKKITEANFKLAADAAKQEYDMQIMLIQATSKSKEEADQRIFNFKKQSLLKTLDLQQKELDSFRGNELEKIAIQEKINNTRYDLEKSGMEERIRQNEVPVVKMGEQKKEEIKLETGKIKTIGRLKQQEGENLKEQNENDIQNEILKQEKKKEIIEAGTQAVIDIQGSLFDFMDKKYQNDLIKLEQKNEAGLLSDKEYAKQKAEIEIKQAKASRLRGIFEATIGVAQAVISALQTKPFFPLGLIMAATAGISGGLQIASILSTPLPTMPAFKEGTLNAPAFGLAGEAGRELGIMSTGQPIMFDKPTVFAGNQFKGMHIYSNPETERMISQTDKPNYGNQNRTDDRSLMMLGNIYKELKNQKRPIYEKDNNKPIGYQESNFRKIFINRRNY